MRTLSLLALVGCSSYGNMDMSSADLGVSPGGAQDMQEARAIIEAGGIPASDTFTAEGLFSEHDLPLDESGTCDALLCPRAAAARVIPLEGGDARALVQLGFDTDLTIDTFERPALDLALAVDVSGSMAGDKIAAVRTALSHLIDQLGEEDRLAIVEFDEDARLLLASTTMDASGRTKAHQIAEGLRDKGSTNIEAGLHEAYVQVAPREGANARVMLLTDAQPNVGATGVDSFVGMANLYADEGIGLTVFGAGLDLGTDLVHELSEIRGGNYFFLADAEEIASIFDDEFDFLVTPLAYDLEVRVAAAEGWTLENAYGAPLDQPGPAVEFGATTLFLSSQDGGMGVLMEPASGGMGSGAQALASFDLSYELALDGSIVEDRVEVAYLGGEAFAVADPATPTADDIGVFKMAVLLDEFEALRSTAAFCEDTKSAAAAGVGVDEARRRIGLVADELGDAALSAEADLMGKLKENLAKGQNACW